MAEAVSHLRDDNSDYDSTEFKDCINGIHTLVSLPASTPAQELYAHLHWASKAKWRQSEQIEELFGSFAEELPRWLLTLYKLGRYYTVVKNMLDLAKKHPDHLPESTQVQAVDAPISEELKANLDPEGLDKLVSKLIAKDPKNPKGEEKERAKVIIKQLGTSWCRENPRATFKEHCSQTFTTHAEVQLLQFYDQHKKLVKNLRLSFMGTSKKTCYLCHKFMTSHHLKIHASASHQKIVLTWKPAPATGSIRESYRTTLRNMCMEFETIAKEELEARLDIKIEKRKSIMDSSAGPSLPPSSGSIVSKMRILSIIGEDKRREGSIASQRIL